MSGLCHHVCLARPYQQHGDVFQGVNSLFFYTVCKGCDALHHVFLTEQWLIKTLDRKKKIYLHFKMLFLTVKTCEVYVWLHIDGLSVY